MALRGAFCIGTSLRCLIELAVVKRGVEAVLLHERFMRAALNDVAVLHDKDKVGVFNCRQAVGNDEACAVFRELIHGALDQKLCARIDGAGRLVQNQHGRVLEHGAGDGQQLLLAGGDAGALGQDGIEAVRQRADEFIQPAGAADAV